jgi:uncharacterized protein (TIGR00251 family)
MKIAVKVKPNAKQQKIEEISPDNYLIHLKSSPVDGKANTELIKLLSEKFHVTKSQVVIKLGLSSRQKVVEINF